MVNLPAANRATLAGEVFVRNAFGHEYIPLRSRTRTSRHRGSWVKWARRGRSAPASASASDDTAGKTETSFR